MGASLPHLCGHWFSVSVKVDVPNSVTYLHWTPIFEWYVDWCGSQNTYQKGDTCGYNILDCMLKR